jgi:hypothetical protein
MPWRKAWLSGDSGRMPSSHQARRRMLCRGSVCALAIQFGQDVKSLVDRFGVREDFGDVGREDDDSGAGCVTLGVPATFSRAEAILIPRVRVRTILRVFVPPTPFFHASSRREHCVARAPCPERPDDRSASQPDVRTMPVRLEGGANWEPMHGWRVATFTPFQDRTGFWPRVDV